MNYISPAIMLAVGLPSLVLLLNVFWAFNGIVRFEHERFPEEWRRDGMPCLLYVGPADGLSRTWRSGIATQRCCCMWFFATPAWSRHNAEAEKALRKYRVLGLAWIFVAVPLWGLTGMLTAYLN